MKTIKELMNMSNRVSLITGGAGHIGSVMGEALAECGCNIALLDQSKESSFELAEQIRLMYGVGTLALDIDISNENAVTTVPEKVLKTFGRLDVLINCAAFVGTTELEGWVVPFKEQSLATWRAAVEVNLTAPFILTQLFAEALTTSGHGSVINVSSIYGMVAPRMSLYEGTSMGNPAAYAASKGGLLQFTRWLATVLAPKVRVNAITPGGVWRNQNEKFHQRYVQQTPLGRMAIEEDFKGATIYLASDLSAYVTGQNIVVDGGWTVW